MFDQVFGMFVVGSAAVASVLWLYVAVRVRPWITSTLHRIVVYLVIGSLVLVNLVVILAVVQLEEVVRLTFGVSMGFQLVAAMAGVLLVRRRRVP